MRPDGLIKRHYFESNILYLTSKYPVAFLRRDERQPGNRGGERFRKMCYNNAHERVGNTSGPHLRLCDLELNIDIRRIYGGLDNLTRDRSDKIVDVCQHLQISMGVLVSGGAFLLPRPNDLGNINGNIPIVSSAYILYTFLLSPFFRMIPLIYPIRHRAQGISRTLFRPCNHIRAQEP